MEAVISGTNPVCVTSNLFGITDTTQILAPPTCGGKKKKLAIVTTIGKWQGRTQ